MFCLILPNSLRKLIKKFSHFKILNVNNTTYVLSFPSLDLLVRRIKEQYFINKYTPDTTDLMNTNRTHPEDESLNFQAGASIAKWIKKKLFGCSFQKKMTEEGVASHFSCLVNQAAVASNKYLITVKDKRL